jgi:hypothetical protein
MEESLHIAESVALVRPRGAHRGVNGMDAPTRHGFGMPKWERIATP